jgi:hypothetical protein
MIANTTTTDYPTPQSVGQPFNIYNGTSPETSASAKQIIFGSRYTSTVNAFELVTYSVYAFINQEYDVYLIQDPGGANIVTTVVAFTAEVTGWARFNVQDVIVQPGAVFDIIAVTLEPQAAPTPVDAIYNYQTPQNPAVPAAGSIQHSRSQSDVMSISYEDDIGGDQTSLITNLTIGDLIAIGTVTWTVQSNIDETTYANVTVTPAIVGTAGVQTVTFTTALPQDTDYMEDVDYWLTSPFAGDVQGIIGIDVPLDSATLNDSAYGVDMTVIQIVLSPDWDVAAAGTSATSGESVSILTADETDWVRASTTLLQYGFATTTDNMWTELARFPIAINTGVKGTLTVDARRTDVLDIYNAEYATLAFNNAGVLSVDSADKFELGPMLLDIRAAADGTDLIFEVRGAISQDWDWQMAIFFRDIT